MNAIAIRKKTARIGAMNIRIGATVAVASSAKETAGLIKAVSLTPLTAVMVAWEAVATPPPPMIAMLHSKKGLMSPINDAVSRMPANAAIGVEIIFINEPTAGI